MSTPDFQEFEISRASDWMIVEDQIESSKEWAIVHDPVYGRDPNVWHVFTSGRSFDWCSSRGRAIESITRAWESYERGDTSGYRE